MRRIIRFIKDRAPAFVANPVLRVLYRRHRGRPIQTVFTEICETEGWGGRESVSGGGSDLGATENIRAVLPGLLDELGVESILDAPCGDFHWMSHVDLKGRRYFGVDVVPALIEQNQHKHANHTTTFRHLDITKSDLPRVDLILCRDCLIHLSYDLIRAVLHRFKESGSRYLLTTTFPFLKRNVDVITGGGRRLNLQLEPFRFPEPLRLLNDDPVGSAAGQSNVWRGLGLWELDAIKL